VHEQHGHQADGEGKGGEQRPGADRDEEGDQELALAQEREGYARPLQQQQPAGDDRTAGPP